MASKILDVQIWSDIACPWCYVGKKRFEAALQAFPDRDSVKVTWRSFELDPLAPREPTSQVPYARRLATKYGSSEAQAQAMINNMMSVAAKEGVQMDFVGIQPGNTFDAHRLLHFAHVQGRQHELKEQLFRAYLCEGKSVAARDVLLEAARNVGLDEEQALSVLATDAYADAVRADETSARQYGISGVPFFGIGRYGVSGAQASEGILSVLRKAWEEAPEVGDPPATVESGPACGPDGCEIR